MINYFLWFRLYFRIFVGTMLMVAMIGSMKHLTLKIQPIMRWHSPANHTTEDTPKIILASYYLPTPF